MIEHKLYNIKQDRFYSGNFFIDERMMRIWGCYLGNNYLSGMWTILLSRLLDTTDFVVISCFIYFDTISHESIGQTNNSWHDIHISSSLNCQRNMFPWMWSSHQQKIPNLSISLPIMFPQHWWWGYCENFNQGVRQITNLFSFSKLTLNLPELSRCDSYQKWCM